MTSSDIDILYVKGMLTTNKTTKPMPTTIKLKLATKNAEKKHSRVFEATTENDIVKSIYFLRPWSDSCTEVTLTVTRNTDAKLESL